MTGLCELSEVVEVKVTGVFRISEEISRPALALVATGCFRCCVGAQLYRA